LNGVIGSESETEIESESESNSKKGNESEIECESESEESETESVKECRRAAQCDEYENALEVHANGCREMARTARRLEQEDQAYEDDMEVVSETDSEREEMTVSCPSLMYHIPYSITFTEYFQMD